MLRSYCLESDKDWDEGVCLLLFAAHKAIQESLGFSPAELVFAHTVRGPLKLLQEEWMGDSTPENLLDYVCDFRLKLHLSCKLAKRNLSDAQVKMKSWFDRNAKTRKFKPGDKVLVLLPIPGSALQARYSGPYVVQEKVSDRDYVVATPECRRQNRLCHINMLKPYLDRQFILQGPDSEDGAVVAALFSAEPAERQVARPLLSSAEPVGTGLSLSGADSAGTEFSPGVDDPAEDDVDPSSATVYGRLNNTEVLSHLDENFPHLSQSQHEDVVRLIKSHLSMFCDVPTRTHVLMHDIDVGKFPPIKQHAYRVCPDKRVRLHNQVHYMLENGIAEPSSSSWSSPCLLAGKSDGSDRVCTDFRKVNAVTKPDCFPLPRVDDGVDHIGAANYVTKLDLLKGYWQVPLTHRAKEISAFVTPDAFLQYTVMPFGVRNAPTTFHSW